MLFSRVHAALRPQWRLIGRSDLFTLVGWSFVREGSNVKDQLTVGGGVFRRLQNKTGIVTPVNNRTKSLIFSPTNHHQCPLIHTYIHRPQPPTLQQYPWPQPTGHPILPPCPPPPRAPATSLLAWKVTSSNTWVSRWELTPISPIFLTPGPEHCGSEPNQTRCPVLYPKPNWPFHCKNRHQFQFF